MKKEQDLKEVIKEAILEAFAEMYGTDTLAAAPSGGGNNGGPKEPDPIVGPAGLSLR